MNSLSKKLTVSILAVIAAICLGVTVLFGLPDSGKTAYAADDTVINLTTSDYLISADGVLTDLTQTAKDKVAGKSFTATIPSSVKRISSGPFANRINLKAVYFDGTFTTLTVDAYAFKGTGLTCADFNDAQINQIIVNNNAFDSCADLNSIYLPAYSADNVFNQAMFGMSKVPLLIAPDKESYNSYLNVTFSGSSNDFKTHIAYKVKLNLNYGGEVHTDYRLGNSVNVQLGNCKYVLQNDGKTWETTEKNGGMPVQDGYAASVWYKDDEYNTNVTANDLNYLLCGAYTGDEGLKNEITLYAKSPDLNLEDRTHLTYGNKEFTLEEAYSYGTADWTEELSEMCTLSIAGYKSCLEPTVESGADKIRNAGTYTLAVNLNANGEYGVLEEPWTITVTVNAAVLKGVDLEWVSVTGNETTGYSCSSLSPSSPEYIFVYNNSEPYFEPKSGNNNLTISSVTNAYLVYSDKEYTVGLRMDKNYGSSPDGDYFDSVTYSGVKQKEAGVYAAQATVTSNNYLIYSDHVRTVTKQWYIVNPTVNGIIDANGSAYDVPSEWEYGKNILKTPYAIFGAGQEGGNITFELTSENTVFELTGKNTISGSQTVFLQYVEGKTLPTDNYTLTVNVGAYGAYEAITEVFEFTVKNISYTYNIEIPDYLEVLYSDANTTPASYPFAKIGGLDKWVESHSGFEARFRIISFNGDSGKYYTVDEYDKNNTAAVYAPKSVGIYTIFYEVSSTGYVPLTGSFTYVIYQEIELEKIQAEIDSLNAVYRGQGTAVKPQLSASEYYLLYLDDSSDSEVSKVLQQFGMSPESYVSAGIHTLAVALNDDYLTGRGVYLYRFVDEEGVSNPSQKYAKAFINIKKASEIRFTLTSDDWEYGNYDPSKIYIVDYENYRLDLSDFEIKVVNTEGIKVEWTTVEEFNILSPGEYKLTATYPDNSADSVTIDIKIKPATVVWETAPVINGWTYGSFTAAYAAPKPVLADRFADIQENILFNAKYGKVIGNTITDRVDIKQLLDENGELPAGRYALVYSHFDGNGKYEDFEYTVYFDVEATENLWNVAPVADGWAYGDKSINYETYKPEFSARFGNAVVKFYMLDENGEELGVGNTLSELVLDTNGHLDVGLYKVTITVAGTASYSELKFEKNFEITKSENGWEKEPVMKGWAKGQFTSINDVLTAVPLNGDLRITITNSNGKAIVSGVLPEDINVQTLNKLGAGKYVLTAYVDGSYKFDGLSEDLDFVVYGTSAAQIALIVLVVILAIIAIALAVIVALLLLRKKKNGDPNGKQKAAKATSAPVQHTTSAHTQQQPAQHNVRSTQQQSAQQQPVQRPVQQTMTAHTQQPVQRPAQQPVRQPVQRPVQPAQQQTPPARAQQPVQRPVQPMRQPVQRPAQQPAQQPVQRPVQQQNVQRPAQPMQRPVQRPSQPVRHNPDNPDTQDKNQ